jgi:dihydrofolate synthase/folylpolyglutamate synthase
VLKQTKDGIRARSVRLERALSRLDERVNWEKKTRDAAGDPMRVSLEPVRDLCARLGAPEAAFRAVHVTGSKGKGSTAALVAGALQAAGVHTALYTSPHLERVSERLTLAGVEVDEERLAESLERALAAAQAAEIDGGPARAATWFDLLTAAAFLVVAEARVELAVIECGLGGRLDSTNVVHGPLAIVTNVYLEHTAVLGPTRLAIAREKAGIVKPGARVVVGALAPDDEAAALVEHVARERGARCVRVEHAPDDAIERRNRRVAEAALVELAAAEPALARSAGGFVLPSAAGGLPGRAERRLHGTTRVVLDGAHVPESLALVLRDLAREPGLAVPPVVVLGMGLEKNAEGLLKALSRWTDTVLCSTVGEGPYRGAEELAALGRGLGLATRAVPDPAAALDEAVRLAGPGGWVLVTGSLHLVGCLRARTRP